MGNHIVDPVVTPSSASGTPSGVLAAALVGPDYHMSPAWTPINMQLGARAPGSLKKPQQYIMNCLLSHPEVARQLGSTPASSRRQRAAGCAPRHRF